MPLPKIGRNNNTTATTKDDVELQHLVSDCSNDAVQKEYCEEKFETVDTTKSTANRYSMGSKGLISSLLERLPQQPCLQPVATWLDERCSVKMLLKVWGPRFAFVARLLLVATFLDDSVRTVSNFSDLANQVGENCFLFQLMMDDNHTSNAPAVLARVALAIGLLSQFLGSLCLLALILADASTKVLIAWVVLQPVLFGQVSNLEFIFESVSVLGGLLLLRAHTVYLCGHDEQSHATNNNYPCVSQCPNQRNGSALFPSSTQTASTHTRNCHRYTQLAGRTMLPAMHLYYAGLVLSSAITLDETSNIGTYLSSLSVFVVELLALLGIVIGILLISVGLRSRFVALMLALANTLFVCYRHPFFRFIWIDEATGDWRIASLDDDEADLSHKMWMTSVVDVNLNGSLPESNFEIDPWRIYDLHRYYFFLGLSTSGALLLLAQIGPGTIAIDRNEVLLPVTRAQD